MKRTRMPREVKDELLVACFHTCVICRDSDKSVQIHHIDANPRNNEPENLIPLCLSCHEKVQRFSPMAQQFTPSQLRRYRNDWIVICKDKVPRRGIQDSGLSSNPPSLAWERWLTKDELPAWFRLSRDSIVQLEGLKENAELLATVEGSMKIKVWVDQILCGPKSKESLPPQLCREKGSKTVWDYVNGVTLNHEGDAKAAILYLLYELRIELFTRIANYSQEEKSKLPIREWYHIVGMFLDRSLRMKYYSRSSLEPRMPRDFFNILMKEGVNESSPLIEYARLFYNAMRWCAIQDGSFNLEFRENFSDSLTEYETRGRAIYNKMQQKKSLHRKFFNYLSRDDPILFRSIVGDTGRHL